MKLGSDFAYLESPITSNGHAGMVELSNTQWGVVETIQANGTIDNKIKANSTYVARPDFCITKPNSTFFWSRCLLAATNSQCCGGCRQFDKNWNVHPAEQVVFTITAAQQKMVWISLIIHVELKHKTPLRWPSRGEGDSTILPVATS